MLGEKCGEDVGVEVKAYGRSFGTIEIRGGIFQGISLTSLIFVFCIISLTLILRIGDVFKILSLRMYSRF